MSLLSELKDIMTGLNIPVETGVFTDKAPDRYIVLTPLSDRYEVFADNAPLEDVQEIRISLFDKGNFLDAKRQIEEALMSAEITITARRYVSHEDSSGYHNYAIDVANYYNVQEEKDNGNNRNG